MTFIWISINWTARNNFQSIQNKNEIIYIAENAFFKHLLLPAIFPSLHVSNYVSTRRK